MRKLIILSLFLMGVSIVTPVLSDDFDCDFDFEKGWQAYKKGDFKTALEVWGPLAEQGDPSAQNNLGVMYYKGYGVAKDNAFAYMRWYIAAINGSLDAVNNIRVFAEEISYTNISAAQQLVRKYAEKNDKRCSE